MSYRLPPVAGEWIDRTQVISFTFEGTRYWGYKGDTISSALWAQGKRVLGRSFKYHRPRGILSFANRDINCLMQDGEKLNVRADVTLIEPDMNLTAVNTFRGLERDRASILDSLSSFLPVGFYYKTFHEVKKLFPFWERQIRKLGGLGELDTYAPRIYTPKRYDFCDVLVIGAGASGLAAAQAAAEAGADVVIVDENARVTNDEITNNPRIRLYLNTEAAGYYVDNWIPLVNPDYMIKMRAKTVIVASGAYEQPAVFRNNDLPGVMLASAAQRLIYRYGVKPMNRAVVLVANRDGYQAAMDLVKHGVTVMAVVDLRLNDATDPVVQELKDSNIPIYTGHCIYEAKSNANKDGVAGAVICPIDENGKPRTEFSRAIACDGIIMSVGWAPAANLLYQAGTKMRFDDHLQQFVPEILPKSIFACGRVNGVYEATQKILDGRRAGLEAVAYLGLGEGARHAPLQVTEKESPSHPYPIIEHPQGKNFVDFDEDLQFKDFINAAKEGFDNIELLKRYTTVGMGASQGKHSNMNALRILAKITGKSPGEIGTTTARPFFHPVPMSHLAGRSFTPERRTPLHSRHAALGAKFMPAGVWQRPEYYQKLDKPQKICISEEAEAVRTRVGIIDVGTLGKIELRGSDAAEFLERVYSGRYANMKVGTTRYALMLDEAGVIVDDGVIARLSAEHFYFTTTTSGATNIYRELSRLNIMWQLDCGIVNLTGARSAINLAGPYAREVLSKLTDLDLSSEAFPYLAVRQGIVAGISAILMRVGFVGEWGYEIHVSTESAPMLWDALLEAGADYDIRPFGVEAQRLLRLEKGHIIVGQDTDGLTTPLEAGLEWAVKMNKPFFIGQRSLQIVAKKQQKQKLVGFMLEEDFKGTPPQERHLIIADGEIAGRITSIAFSPTLKRYIGLAYIKPDIDNRFSIRLSDGSYVTGIVSPTPFYDPDNNRQHRLLNPPTLGDFKDISSPKRGVKA
ncbi:MAG: 2Fe-2S iron-sulfur cluster-binding protein [Hydrococcus sp. Prado102]|nr:2Fe-2S iron-sulfur cluster-binding protein [Hydrococcus sp. Prado102]